MRRAGYLFLAFMVCLAACDGSDQDSDVVDTGVTDAGRLDSGAADGDGGERDTADGDVSTGPTGIVEVPWKINGFGDTGDGCTELGATTIELVAVPAGEDPSSAHVTEGLACNAGIGESDPLPLGDYDVHLAARDQNGELLAYSSTHAASLTADGDVHSLGEMAFQVGTFEFSWQLTDLNSNAPLTCAEANAGGIEVRLELDDAEEDFEQVLPCPSDSSQGQLTTQPRPLGAYTVTVSLLEESTDNPLDDVSLQANVDEHAVVVNLGAFDFVVQ